MIVTYIHWVALECIMFSVMVTSYERNEPCIANGTRYVYF